MRSTTDRWNRNQGGSGLSRATNRTVAVQGRAFAQPNTQIDMSVRVDIR